MNPGPPAIRARPHDTGGLGSAPQAGILARLDDGPAPTVGDRKTGHKYLSLPERRLLDGWRFIFLVYTWRSKYSRVLIAAVMEIVQ